MAIVGAGIVGLACALELAQTGLRVTVYERGTAMQESSWAAAGMLAVNDPENPPALLPLARLSREIYPAFLTHVERLSGMRVPFRTTATLQGTRAPHGRAAPPELLPKIAGTAWHFSLLDELSLDPRDLCRALPLAVRTAGIAIHEQTPVEHATTSQGERQWLLYGSGSQALGCADHLVIAAGAWSGQIKLGMPDEAAILRSIAPRKGQMIEVLLHENAPALPMVIRTPELYLVPRGDRRVAIGATVEYADFDRTIDEAAGDTLWRKAAELWPPILEGQIQQRWTGLRPGFVPGLPDDLPVIGSLRQVHGQMHGENAPPAWAATGHFRNGILLAPGTARLLRQLVLGEIPTIDPDRFLLASDGPHPSSQ